MRSLTAFEMTGRRVALYKQLCCGAGMKNLDSDDFAQISQTNLLPMKGL